MKKYVKIVLSVILCITLSAGITAVALAAPTEASLCNVYGDSMLFEQNADAVFAGTAQSGSTVRCELIDESDTVIRSVDSTADSSGKFKISFTAPAGGYKEYTVKFYLNGTEFRELKGVVFGELWLASGQSNMQYSLGQSDTYEQNKKGSEWLRFLFIDPYATYGGNPNEFPLDAQYDIENGCCRWMKGTDDDLGGISAVSFFFAQELQKKLDMPVGVLMPNLGGSMLASWLSRETIDSDSAFADYLKEKDMYIAAEDWDSSKVVWYSTMTSNYNKKVTPLHNFSIAGMIWYQGESEILTTWDIGYYQRGLELLQGSYSELFDCDGKLPFIAVQVAPYAYGKNMLNLHNNEFVDFQKADPTSRAVTTIYDLSLDYLAEAGAIHPGAKQPVGERMAACAENMVYGKSSCFTAATVKSVRIDGSDLYVTLKDTGDGLSSSGDILRGFALCEKGGVYVQADAEIVSADTIRIFSNEVKNPVAATYAFAQNNNNANVYSTIDGKKFLPVAPFSTDIKNDKLYWDDPEWTSCDSESAWLLSGDSNAGINKIWTAENAEINIDSDKPFFGEGCLNIVANAGKKFTVSPVFTYLKDKKVKYFDHALTNWANYSAVSVMVRNNGKSDVSLDEMRIYTGKLLWYAPQINGSGEANEVIPADGQWHKLTFDLDSLCLFGNECGATYSRIKLGSIKSLELNFEGEKEQSCDISIDEFRFTADASDGSRVRFDTSIAKADNIFELISAMFVVFISKIVNIFN